MNPEFWRRTFYQIALLLSLNLQCWKSVRKLSALKLKYFSFLVRKRSKDPKQERISQFLVSLYFIDYRLFAHLIMSGLKLSFKNSVVPIFSWDEMMKIFIYFFAIKFLLFWVSFRKLPFSSPNSFIDNWSLHLWSKLITDYQFYFCNKNSEYKI